MELRERKWRHKKDADQRFKNITEIQQEIQTKQQFIEEGESCNWKQSGQSSKSLQLEDTNQNADHTGMITEDLNPIWNKQGVQLWKGILKIIDRVTNVMEVEERSLMVQWSYCGREKIEFTQVSDAIQCIVECYMYSKESEKLKKKIIRVLSEFLLNSNRQSSKKNILKGLKQFCEYVVEMEMFEVYSNIWENLSDLLVAIRRPESDNPINGDIDQSSKPKGTDLNELAPVFLASFSDTREEERYDLLINTMKKLTGGPNELQGLAFEFKELVQEHFKGKLDEQKFEEALKKGYLGMTNYNSLYDIFYNSAE